MQDFEKLGLFYLGRTVPEGPLLLYDSRDLMTHAVCVGMTGSGKTGLCIGLLEEAAIDGIPALIIDPKGDLTNLLLRFPSLSPAEFEPWVNEGEARSQGLTRAQFAARQAELWRQGLARWGQDGARIQRLRDSADSAIYTPGSEAGLPVSVLRSFAAPAGAIAGDREAIRDRVHGAVTALLGLLGIDADPIQSREHILLAHLLDHAWRQGRDLDLGSLIPLIQQPPVQRLGVLEVDAFFPPKERFQLAMALNGLLASPGFEAWMHGEALDIDRLLYTPEGKPRHSIFCIAHLSDAERMFFVSILLNQVVSWMKSQPGTTSLRAIVYMDEIFGYFPPVANPPSKLPLLRLLKQARAFGVGVVLATQNPADLDYKGLANAGTWLIGRLQTERDKLRVLEGLEGAAASAGTAFDRASLDKMLSGLGKRIFLMNNVHDRAPVLFESRWALSYLAGPLTRAQIQSLMNARKQAGAGATPAVSTQPARARTAHAPAGAAARPILPPEIAQYFLPAREGAGSVAYAPHLLAALHVRWTEARHKLDFAQHVTLLTPVRNDALPVQWEESFETALDPDRLQRSPVKGATFDPLPPQASAVRSYAAWQKDLVAWVVANQKLTLFVCPPLKMRSEPGESEREFQLRLRHAGREDRDRLAEKLRARFAPRRQMLLDRLQRAQAAAAREAEQARAAQWNTVLSVGSGLLDAFLGRKAVGQRAVSHVRRAATSYGRMQRESGEVASAQQQVAALEKRLQELEWEFEMELQRAASPASGGLVERLEIAPKKTNVQVRMLALTWAPFRRDGSGEAVPAWE